jgi:AraC-like DNA-binding protein
MSYNSKVETFRIKGMCCSRCVRALKEELSKLSLTKLTVRIGEAELVYGKEIISFEQIQNAVEDAGFEIMTLLQNKKIEEVKEYVRRHLADSNALRLSVLSRAVAVSPYHLSRTFSLTEKETLQDFIIRTRVEYAAQLLRDTERTVLDICLDVGFNSTSHFTKQFKKHFGQTPLSYRKKPLESNRRLFFRKFGNDFKKSINYVREELIEHISSIHGKHS